MALASVVVFDFFICCRGDESKRKKKERKKKKKQRQEVKRRSREGRQEKTRVGVRMQGEKSDKVGLEHTMQRIVLAEPSVFHLFKLMEGNRKQRERQRNCSQSGLHARHITSTHPGFIWDSKGRPGCGGKLFKGHVKVYKQTWSYHTDMKGSTQAPHVHMLEN